MWSQIQRKLYDLIDPNLKLQVHCAVYPGGGRTCLNGILLDLKKRHAALEAHGLGLLGERHDAAVVVGEHNNRFAAQLGTEKPLAAAVKRIAVQMEKNRRRHLHTNLVLR